MLVLPSVNGSSVESKKTYVSFRQDRSKRCNSGFCRTWKTQSEIEYFANSEIIDSIESRVVGKRFTSTQIILLIFSRRIPLIRVSAQRIFPSKS